MEIFTINILFFFCWELFLLLLGSSLPFSASADFSPPSSVEVAAAPSAPSASPVPSAASASAGFSGSLKTVGAATVAITKSLP